VALPGAGPPPQMTGSGRQDVGGRRDSDGTYSRHVSTSHPALPFHGRLSPPGPVSSLASHFHPRGSVNRTPRTCPSAASGTLDRIRYRPIGPATAELAHAATNGRPPADHLA